AADIGVKEVYLQRLVFFEQDSIGMANPDQALFEKLTADEAVHLRAAEDLARSLGLTFSASGAASEPGVSLVRQQDGNPWSLCRRPWTVMYFTAHGRAPAACARPGRRATRSTRSPMPRGRGWPNSGTPRAPGPPAPPCCGSARRRPAPIAACAGACDAAPRHTPSRHTRHRRGRDPLP